MSLGQKLRPCMANIWISRTYKMYRLGGDLNSVVCKRVTSPEEFSIDEQLFVGIYILHFVSAVSP